MAVTSVTVGGLEINDGVTYAVSADTLTMLEAANPEDARLVDMAFRPPVYVGSQPLARPISLGVYMTATTGTQRKTDYDALKAALDNSAGLIPLTWTDGATTLQLLVHRGTLTPSRWFHRASGDLVAPDPTPVSI
jgi:hypothetical protein